LNRAPGPVSVPAHWKLTSPLPAEDELGIPPVAVDEEEVGLEDHPPVRVEVVCRRVREDPARVEQPRPFRERRARDPEQREQQHEHHREPEQSHQDALGDVPRVRFPVRTSYIARWISTENRFGAVANAISFERISASVEPRRLIRHPPLGKAAVADGGVHEQPDEHDADDQDCGR